MSRSLIALGCLGALVLAACSPTVSSTEPPAPQAASQRSTSSQQDPDMEIAKEKYLPVVFEIREIIDPLVGPLTWKMREEIKLVDHTERSPFLRIGTSFGEELKSQRINEKQVLSDFNTAVTKYGFSPAQQIAREDGGAALNATNDECAIAELRISPANVRVWVDLYTNCPNWSQGS